MADLITHVPSASSHIERLDYDPVSRQLHVKFKPKPKQSKRHTYTYINVPIHVFEIMRASPSPGEYLHAVIKRHYKLV